MSQFVPLLFIIAIVFVLAKKYLPQKTSVPTKAPSQLPAGAESEFILCAFSMLAKLAAADGDATRIERERVEKYITEELGLDRKAGELALKVYDSALNSPLELRDYAERFEKTFRSQHRLKDRMVQLLLELSATDGVLSKEEDRAIRSSALLLGLSEVGYERLKNRCFPDSSNLH